MAATAPRSVAAILVAAGSGARLGAAVPKAFVPLAGRSLLQHAVARFAAVSGALIVVAPESHVDIAVDQVPDAIVVVGGATRQQSVAAGLAAVPGAVELVLVHDVARPLVTDAVIRRVLDALAAGAQVVVPVLEVTDSIRTVTGEPVDRTSLRAVQTPQGFTRAALVAAHAPGGAGASDDATLAEAAGFRVNTVAGAPESFKITRPIDLTLAEAMLR